MSDVLHSIGVDVCKQFLDIHLYPTSQRWRVPNTIVGLLSVRSHLPAPVQVKRVVLESTGGYEREAALWFSQSGYPVSVINARQGRNFARAMNQQAKTDQVDADSFASLRASSLSVLRFTFFHRHASALGLATITL
jgi:transposase